MGNETSKSLERRKRNGDMEKYLTGMGIDIGCGRDPLPGAIEFDKVINNKDAHNLKEFNDGYFDYVYSSHCLEHLEDPATALDEWWRVIKPGGYLYIAVPDFALYEKRIWPSKFNNDHKTTWNIYKLAYLIAEFFDDAQVLRLQVNDEGFDYSDTTSDQTARGAQAEVECIVRKVKDKFWADKTQGDKVDQEKKG